MCSTAQHYYAKSSWCIILPCSRPKVRSGKEFCCVSLRRLSHERVVPKFREEFRREHGSHRAAHSGGDLQVLIPLSVLRLRLGHPIEPCTRRGKQINDNLGSHSSGQRIQLHCQGSVLRGRRHRAGVRDRRGGRPELLAALPHQRRRWRHARGRRALPLDLPYQSLRCQHQRQDLDLRELLRKHSRKQNHLNHMGLQPHAPYGCQFSMVCGHRAGHRTGHHCPHELLPS